MEPASLDPITPSFPGAVAARLPENPELRHQVCMDLEERIAAARPEPGGDTAEQAAERLRKSPAPPGRRGLWPVIVCSLAVVLWIAAMAVEVPGILLEIGGSPELPPFLKEESLSGGRAMVTSQAVFHPTLAPYSELTSGSRRIWEQHPDDPALFFTHANLSRVFSRTLPADYDTVWRRLDPDNAVWLLLKSTFLMQESIKRDPATGANMASDPAKFSEAITAFEEASRMPRFHNFRSELYDRTLASFRPPRTQAEANFLQAALRSSSVFRYRRRKED